MSYDIVLGTAVYSFDYIVFLLPRSPVLHVHIKGSILMSLIVRAAYYYTPPTHFSCPSFTGPLILFFIDFFLLTPSTSRGEFIPTRVFSRGFYPPLP